MTQMAANPPLLAQSNNVGWRHEIDVIGSGGPTSNPIATIASATRSSASSTSTASNHQFHSSPAATSTTTSKSQLHVTTVTTDGGQNISSIYSPNSSASRFSDLHSSTNMTASDLRSPTSFQTRTSTSSYRSPTKWTHFENEDSEFDEDDGDHSKPGVSSDTETRNLLEADACSPEPDDSDMLFVPCEGLSMTTQQRAYYTNCFVRLLKDTQSTTDVTYALRGSHERVMDFFEKSGLDKEDLSRVWNLTDVNEDGWLNLGEFCAAMHIIVLHIKGGMPIPSQLPVDLQPPMTPVRTGPRSQDATPLQVPVPTGSAQSWRHFEPQHNNPPIVTPSAPTSSNDKSPKLKHFSQAPPPVDRPTPVKVLLPPGPPATLSTPTGAASKLPLSPQGPKGPPPKPPPRPVRGHARSASLDLNTIAVPAAPIAITTAAHEVATPPAASFAASSATIERYDAETQTGDERLEGDGEHLMDFGAELDEAVRRATEAAEGRPLDWKQKCDRLRVLNADLDQERTRLAQVRLQLELRLQEIKQAKD